MNDFEPDEREKSDEEAVDTYNNSKSDDSDSYEIENESDMSYSDHSNWGCIPEF